MTARIESFDWSKTSLGPQENWSLALRTTVRILLANRFPMLLWWGADYICIYNDAYRSILGRKHPWALGQPVREVWSEIWDVLRPLIDTPFHGGPSSWSEDIELHLNRSGFTEETHFTIAYSPVPDDSLQTGIGGVLATVTEVTEKVIGQRRMTILRDLGARAMEAKSADEALTASAAILASYPNDVPFALFYLADEDGTHAKLTASCGVADGADIAPETIPLNLTGPSGWPLGEVHPSGMLTVENLVARFADIPSGPWPDAPHTAAILSMRSHSGSASGFVIVGLSSHLALDDSCKYFLELATSQISTAITNAHAYEQERRRAEALAELDRAKTQFFSNVSHEFRTPLTLMLGPIEELLKQSADLKPDQLDRLSVAHRNSLRLLRLVNSLLDFSRIESGRMTASFEPVDLSEFTTNLAASFRSVMEAAGLHFVVESDAKLGLVFVDRDLWEKIVLNLLSNAFKFTMKGRVVVRLTSEGSHATLSVADTGTGIPESELPRVFERFYRVEGAQGRSYEGTGIGLALIQELVKIHGGRIHVESRVGEGSTFRVSIPFGAAHLPQEHLRSSRTNDPTRASAFTGEALNWLARPETRRAISHRKSEPRERILLADDNADMRDHVHQILSDDYDIRTVATGEELLQAAREAPPDLILTDVMMPGLDGFGLLRSLRDDPCLRDIPVVMLSARAGEEARTEGIAAGADDYLTKPFSAREMRTRIRTMLNLRSMRREAEVDRGHRAAQFEALLNQAPIGVYLVDADFRMQHMNPTARAGFAGIPDPIGRRFDEVLHEFTQPDYADEVVRIFRHTLATGEPFATAERESRRIENGQKLYFEWRVDRIPLADGRYGVVCYFHDISALVRARQTIAESEQRLSLAVEGGGMGTWDVDLATGASLWSKQHFAMLGYSPEPNGKATMDMWRARIHPEDLERVDQKIQGALTTGMRYISEHRVLRADTGEVRWLSEFGHVLRRADGKAVRFVGISFDNTARNRAEQELLRTAEHLRRVNEDLEQFAYSASHDLQEPLRGVRIYSELLSMELAGKLTEKERECLAQVREGSERMEILLGDLTAYIEACGIERNVTEAVDAGECLQEALGNLATTIKETGARIAHGPLPSIHVDAMRLRQIFQNLVANAIKYRKPDVAPDIYISAEQHDRMWRFAVHDNGIGIAPEFHAQIFGLFKRLHTRHKYAGTGIGLALCARIVGQYHGRIWVESALGKGSTFYFTLPA